MSHQAVSCGQAAPVAGADDESLCGVQGGCWWQDVHEVTHEAETDRAGVEARAVGTSAVPSSAFVDNSSVSNAEVVTNIGPAIGIHVEILDVTHLSVAKRLSVATSASSVMNDEMGRGLGCQPCWVSCTRSPGRSGTDVGTRSGLGVGTDGQASDQQCNEEFHLSALKLDTGLTKIN